MRRPDGGTRGWAPEVLAAALVLAAAGGAAAGEPGRISDANGELKIQGGYSDDWTEVGRNAVVGAGDRIWLDPRGLAEIELPGDVRVRMLGEARLELPLDGDGATAHVVEGHFAVRTNATPFTIDLADHRLTITHDSLVRIDADGDAPRVGVLEGSAQLESPAAPEPAIRLDRSQELRIGRQDMPAPLTSSEDALDRYNRDRDSVLQRYRAEAPPLAQPVVGMTELYGYGQWVTIGGGAYWRPFTPAGWRPYSVGYWAWYRPFGWTWISGDPFGYVTFHYGRWIFDATFGWAWYPGSVFAPAYVQWMVFGGFYAWAPLDPFGFPVVTGPNVIIIHNTRVDSRAWSHAPVHQFERPPRRFVVRDWGSGERYQPIERRFLQMPSARPVQPTELVRPGGTAPERRFTPRDRTTEPRNAPTDNPRQPPPQRPQRRSPDLGPHRVPKDAAPERPRPPAAQPERGAPRATPETPRPSREPKTDVEHDPRRVLPRVRHPEPAPEQKPNAPAAPEGAPRGRADDGEGSGGSGAGRRFQDR